MTVKVNILAIVFLFASLFNVFAQGFASLGKTDQSFSNIDKNLIISFPKDHGPHPDFRIEWWYFTANLKNLQNKPIGVQWTLFRTALESQDNNNEGWSNKQVWIGHAATTDESDHLFSEKIARGGINQAGVSVIPFNAWIDDWYIKGENWEKLELSANTENFQVFLELEAMGPIVKHGKNGLSFKSATGNASAYYSQPFFKAQGWVKKNGSIERVAGTAWADREWSSQPLAEDQLGWDWFSMNLNTDDKLMLFRVRGDSDDNFASATWIDKHGKPTSLSSSDIIFQPLSENEKFFPILWRIEIPKLNINLTAEALNPESFMDTFVPYWEGPIKISGSHEGNGYLEMTGYSQK